jgi:Tfp pilus assembly protein PilF
MVETGYALLQAGRIAEARDIFLRISSTHSGYTDACHYLCNIAISERDVTQAETWAQRHQEQAPSDPRALNNLGMVRYIQEEWDAAQASFRRAIQLGGAAETHNNLGMALLHLGEEDEAKKCFRQAVEMDEQCIHAFVNLGKLALKRGDVEQAHSCVRKVLDIQPSFRPAHWLLAKLQLLQPDGVAPARDADLE